MDNDWQRAKRYGRCSKQHDGSERGAIAVQWIIIAGVVALAACGSFAMYARSVAKTARCFGHSVVSFQGGACGGGMALGGATLTAPATRTANTHEPPELCNSDGFCSVRTPAHAEHDGPKAEALKGEAPRGEPKEDADWLRRVRDTLRELEDASAHAARAAEELQVLRTGRTGMTVGEVRDRIAGNEQDLVTAQKEKARLLNDATELMRSPKTQGKAQSELAATLLLHGKHDVVLDAVRREGAPASLRELAREHFRRMNPDVDSNAERATKDAEKEMMAAFNDQLKRDLGKLVSNALDADGTAPPLARLMMLREVKARKLRGVNKRVLEQSLRLVEPDPTVKKELSRLAEGSLSKARAQLLARRTWSDRVTYLESDAFRAYLALLGSDKERDAELVRYVSPLAVVDPERAIRIVEGVAAGRLARRFHGMSVDDLYEEVLGSMLRRIEPGAPLKAGKGSADVGKRYPKVVKAAKTIAEFAVRHEKGEIGKVTAALAEAAKEGSAAKKTADTWSQWMTKLDDHGAVTSTGAAIGLLILASDLMEGKAFKDEAKTLDSLATIAKTIDATEGAVKAYRAATGLPGLNMDSTATRASALGRTVLISKFGGALGDVLTAQSKLYESEKALLRGDSLDAMRAANKALLASSSGMASLASAATALRYGAATGTAAGTTVAVTGGVSAVFLLAYLAYDYATTPTRESKLLEKAQVDLATYPHTAGDLRREEEELRFRKTRASGAHRVPDE